MRQKLLYNIVNKNDSYNKKERITLMRSRDIFCNNVRKLLATKGWCYANLADNCKGKLSKAYVNSFRDPNKINPTLDVLDAVAETFGISVLKLMDPNLEYNRVENDLPEGYVKKEVLLTKLEYSEVKDWEEVNKKKVEAIKRKNFLKLNELKK